jgi:hypothetical protein
VMAQQRARRPCEVSCVRRIDMLVSLGKEEPCHAACQCFRAFASSCYLDIAKAHVHQMYMHCVTGRPRRPTRLVVTSWLLSFQVAEEKRHVV